MGVRVHFPRVHGICGCRVRVSICPTICPSRCPIQLNRLSTTVASNCLRADHGPSTLGIIRISDDHAIDAFVAACFTWCLNDHFLSSHTPKYFIFCLRGITSPLISNRADSYFLRRVTKIASHLRSVSCKNLLVSHSAINSISTNHAFSTTIGRANSSANPTSDAPFGSFILNSP